MKKMSKKINIICVLIFVISLVLDQFTKYLAKSTLIENPITIIEGVFSLTYLENRGVGFGLLQNRMYLILAVNIIVLFLITFIYFNMPKTRRLIPVHVLLTLIVSGAVGNIIDRVRLGYVVDFFYFELIDFPIFNVADIYVSVSVVLLVLLMLFVYSSEEIDSLLTFGKSKKNGETADE